MEQHKTQKRLRIRRGIRKKIQGTAARPRLAVYKSNKRLYAQLIDDVAARTLAYSSSQAVGMPDKNNCEVAKQVGEKLATAAKKQNITSVVFDRGGWPYHGKLRALAEGARAQGLIF